MTKWKRGDLAESNVTWLRSAPLGSNFRVIGTHEHNGELVLDVMHPRYGHTSYFASSFINRSRTMPLFNQEKKMIMDTSQPIVVVEIMGEGLTWGGIVQGSGRAYEFNSLEVAKRDLPVGKRWAVLQAVGVLKPEQPKPSYVFRSV